MTSTMWGRAGSLGLKGKTSAELDDEFEAFRRANPHVERELVALLNLWVARGRQRVGIGMLFEVLRWNRYLQTGHADFKLNNNHRSRYARLLMANYPAFAGIFETRELKP